MSMKNIKKFENYINESFGKFRPQSVQWSRKPPSWENVKHSLLLSHLTQAQRNDLIDNHIKGNIYDSVEYQLSHPTKYFEDIWGGDSAPRFFIVRHSGGLGNNYYLINTEGYDYAKYVVRIDDLEKWVNIEENLY